MIIRKCTHPTQIKSTSRTAYSIGMRRSIAESTYRRAISASKLKSAHGVASRGPHGIGCGARAGFENKEYHD